MVSISSILAIAIAATGAMASDVYSTFYSDEGQIAPNFDIANGGCFTADSAVKVSFSQKADGPYCLSAWTDGGCPGAASATETFSSLSSGTQYSLDQDMQIVGSYKWNAAGGC